MRATPWYFILKVLFLVWDIWYPDPVGSVWNKSSSDYVTPCNVQANTHGLGSPKSWPCINVNEGLSDMTYDLSIYDDLHKYLLKFHSIIFIGSECVILILWMVLSTFEAWQQTLPYSVNSIINSTLSSDYTESYRSCRHQHGFLAPSSATTSSHRDDSTDESLTVWIC